MWKKILAGIIVFIVAIVMLVMYATSGMTEVANEFFIHVKTKHYKDAYNMLSEDFQKSTPEEAFKNFLIENALTEYKSASWSDRSFENDIGKLEGTVETKSGGKIPLTMSFVKSAESWKIYSIYKPSSGIQTEKESKTITTPVEKPTPVTVTTPSKETLIPLIHESTMLFAQSVNEKSMSKLYNYISNFWRKRTSVKALDKAFDPFYKAGLDLTVLEGITPVLDKQVKITKEGEMIIEGHYPTSPSVIHFRNIYLKENGKWKMSGININIK